MKIRLLLIILVFWPVYKLQANDSLLYQMPRTQVVPIQNSQLNRAYELYIKLPEGYEDEENRSKKYPVIYFTDAKWHIDILSGSTLFLIEDAILVGISWQKDIDKALIKEHGEHVSRFRDYSFLPSNKPKIQEKYQLGQANNHLAFIRNDVFKFVESQYRTQPQNRSYFGYSAGGSFGAYVLLSQPDTFKHYLLGSPALKGDIPFLTELVEKKVLAEKGFNANVFVTYGTKEKEAAKYIDKLITLLTSKNDSTLLLKHQVIEGTHQTAFPLTGVSAVTWLATQLNGDK